MPVSPQTKAADLGLRVPQARVLAVLMPPEPDTSPIDWPTVTRAQLGVRAGYTAISGSVTRALNGIRPGSTSDASVDSDGNKIPGKGHPGLLARGMVEEIVLDIDGVEEVDYRITALGIQAYQMFLKERGDLPAHRDKDTCTNERYRKNRETYQIQ